MEKLNGTVERFLFQDSEKGFSVFLFSIEKEKNLVVTTRATSFHIGQDLEIEGAWVTHPKFGKQFEAQTVRVFLPTSVIGLRRYLSSGMIKGIGKVYADKLVNYFGAQVLEVIDKEPDRLQEVPGIGPKRVETIIAAWRDHKEVANIMVFLQDKGASPAFAVKIYKKYGAASISIVTENPYKLAEDIFGVGFKTADTIAQNLGFEKESSKRIKAGILFALNHASSSGHLYVEIETLKKQIITLLELTQSDNIAETIRQSLRHLHDEDKIKLITKELTHYITTSQFYHIEKNSAKKLQALQKHASACEFIIQDIYASLRVFKEKEIELNEAQQKGILDSLQSKVSIITGGPGTGKTTLVKKLLQILDQHKVTYKLAAPTGRAAKRMIESTGKFAVTLHRLLEFNPQTFTFTYDERNALKVDFLIIDESSMIDIFLAYAIIKALPLTSHVIFIGDIDQLPPVGPGNFLHDLIKSKLFPVTTLSFIFRQSHNSLIAYNAHLINQGKMPVQKADCTFKDYFFIPEEDPGNILIHLKKIMHYLHRFSIKQQDAIILSPMNKGVAGTQKLNNDMQSLMNPEKKDAFERMFSTLKLDDPVIQIRNNYDKHVFNGDIGIIKHINAEDKIVTVTFLEKEIQYDFSELDELLLAYAISIHKSQGSEFSAVIIPLFMQHFTLLQRNLIYTALTRAKKVCFIIGQYKALAMAIKNTESSQRITFLTEYLTSELVCR